MIKDAQKHDYFIFQLHPSKKRTLYFLSKMKGSSKVFPTKTHSIFYSLSDDYILIYFSAKLIVLASFGRTVGERQDPKTAHH